ncbi:MAG: single-stranded DNA-binding protein, partial [Candidatus Methanomethylophilaceae archaeon]|nr:single-stranded DNA-binding protein [Candidatus Methanomethylophilaceae archaeon]
LDKYLNEYHVGIDAAKRGIMRKYGASDSTSFVTAGSVVKKVGELTGTEQNVDITAKVVYVDNKNITVKGLSKTIISGILGDETGTASFTVWEPGSVMLEKGAVYNFKNCYCKLWNEKVQINLGNRGRVEPASGVTMDLPERTIQTTSRECKIGDITDGMGNVTVTGRILSAEARDVTVKGAPKTVYSGIMADDTGKIQYSAWNDFSLKEGETICVKNAYIRSWKGIPQLNLGDRCEVSRVNVDFETVDTSSPLKTVDEVSRIGGGLDITIEGLIVDIKAGSGLIRRCPQCNRSILNGTCTAHGQVEGIPDLRLKVVVDDGTGAIGAIINRTDTEKLTGVSMAAAQGLASVQGEGIVGREMAGKALMKRVRITGNVMSDNFGPSMIVKKMDTVEVDLEGEAAKLLEEVEASL